MLNNVANRLYKLAKAFDEIGNDIVARKLKDACEIIDDEVQKIETNFEEYENAIHALENPQWFSGKPTEVGYYIWKELNRPSCNMNRRVARIKKHLGTSELFISFEIPESGLEEYTRLALIADRQWLKVSEL